ncbi:MAG: hypothetical protein M3N47_12220, partial [Chloroflexota bacterium]|nr:hypothetical protein [Chloroflexota bacterium]
MRSLNAHLRDAETHDRLAFHPSCPICRHTRLTGPFSATPVVSPRAQALVAASALAVSATAPAPIALAAEPDHEHEGTAQVVDTGPGDPAANRDFDPGGEPTTLPEAASPAVTGDASNDNERVDQPQMSDANDPVIDAGDEADTAAARPATGPPETTAPNAAGATPAPAPPVARENTTPPAPGTSPDAIPAPPPATEASAAPSAAPPRRGDHAAKGATDRKRPTSTSVNDHTASAATTTAPTTPTAAPAPAAVATAPPIDGRRAKPGDRAHTVLPGES